MKRLHSLTLLLLLVGTCTAPALNIITATIAVTNIAGTTNGQTLTVNGNVRTWTNSVGVPATQILTNSTSPGAATNLYFQIASYPYSGLSLSRTTSTNITLETQPGGPLTVTLSAGWGTVTLLTNALGEGIPLRIPRTASSLTVQTNLASGVVDWISCAANTNEIQQASKAAMQLMGLTNAQTITGAKDFTSQTSIWRGGVSNAPYLSATNAVLQGKVGGTALTLMGFLRTSFNAFFGSAITWSNSAAPINLRNIRVLIQSDGTLVWQNVTDDGLGTSDLMSLNPTTGALWISGDFTGGIANATNANASTVFGSGVIPNAQLNDRTLTNATFVGTNNYPINSDLAFTRYAVTSLANGPNAAVPIGTNYFIEVSGPSGAFTINGIAAGNAQRDGKEIIILNKTGFDMTIANQSGTDPTPANRIISMTGADRTTTGNGAARLIYSASDSRWNLISFDP